MRGSARSMVKAAGRAVRKRMLVLVEMMSLTFWLDINNITMIMRSAFVYRMMNNQTSFVFSFLLELGSPESQVVSDQLHDGGGILVLVLLDLVDVGDGVIEGLLGELAGFRGVVLDFVVEDGVVEGETQSDGVGGLKILFGSLGGSLVGFVSVVSGLISLVASGVLRNVSVVITLHFEVEDLGFGVGSLGDEAGVDEVEDLVAVFVELSLDLVLVASEEADIFGSLLLLLLLDGGKGSPGGSAGADGILEGNGQKVSLLDGEVGIGSHDLVHGFEHVLKPFGLLGDLGHIEVFLSGVGSH